MNCDQAKTEIIAYLNNELNQTAKTQFEEHIAGCEACRKELIEGQEMLNRMQAASAEATVKMVDDILLEAIKAGASDIHMDPQSDTSLLVRIRVDGVMQQVRTLKPEERYALVDRLKMLGQNNAAERRIPTDGKFTSTFGETEYDFRIATSPTVLGERVIIRVLDRSNACIGLEPKGMSKENLNRMTELLSSHTGMILVVGPSGSGRTTTLYSMLSRVADPAKQTVTIEDPVEYLIPGVNQTQVNVKNGLTYANALRAEFRHDPDVIMVGGIHNYDTAILSIQFAMTGHLVMAAMLPSNTLGTIRRLREMEIDDFMIGSSLIGVIAQRLVRCVCPHCKKEVEIEASLAEHLGLEKGTHVWRGQGCDQCRKTGYKGRTAVYEVLQVDKELAELISTGASIDQIEERAKTKGFQTMLDDGRQKVLEGITTPEEIIRCWLSA